MKKTTILISILFVSVSALCQNPVHWSFSAKKIKEGCYEVHLTATVDPPWHTYSQTTPDGGPLPTKISFSKNPLITPAGKTAEKGKLVTEHDKVFEVDVKYFDGDVDFVQVFNVKGNAHTAVNGRIEYMACKDQQCLSPQTIPFNIKLP